jgi:hypothetical protein
MSGGYPVDTMPHMDLVISKPHASASIEQAVLPYMELFHGLL